MKPVDKLIDQLSLNPEHCVWCRLHNGEFICIANAGAILSANEKYFSGDEACTKADWDGCPFNGRSFTDV